MLNGIKSSCSNKIFVIYFFLRVCMWVSVCMNVFYFNSSLHFPGHWYPTNFSLIKFKITKKKCWQHIYANEHSAHRFKANNCALAIYFEFPFFVCLHVNLNIKYIFILQLFFLHLFCISIWSSKFEIVAVFVYGSHLQIVLCLLL